MNDNIILYTQQGCGICRTVHILLDNKHIKYEESQDTEVMKSKGITHTPALEVNGVILQGVDINKYIKTGELPNSCNSCEVK